jgi:hypothetical protein
MKNYPYKTEQRLAEAKTCIERMRGAQDVYAFKEAFLSFLNASRFALDPLKSDCQQIQGFTEWWKQKAEFMEGHTLCKLFRALRNDVTKGGKDPFFVNQEIRGPMKLSGPLQIGSHGILKGDMTNGRVRWSPMKVEGVTTTIGLVSAPEEFRNIDPVKLSEKYFELLSQIVDEFVLQFCTDN